MSPADVRRRKGRMRAPSDRRFWEMFEGESQFYCSGRYISGPGTLNVLGTAFVIIIPPLIFVFRVAVLLAEVAKLLGHSAPLPEIQVHLWDVLLWDVPVGVSFVGYKCLI